MTVEQKDAAAFFGYMRILDLVEAAFNECGMHIKFHAFIDPVYGKVIKVTGGFASQKIICIEADSPVAAIKDLVAGVKIS
jgi:hypothetical protein